VSTVARQRSTEPAGSAAATVTPGAKAGRPAGQTGTTGPAGATIAEEAGAVAARPAGAASPVAEGARSTYSTLAAIAEEEPGAPTSSAHGPRSAGAAGATVAGQHSAAAAVATRGTDSAGAALAAAAEQASRPAGAAGLSCRARSTIAAVAHQDPAGPAVSPGRRRIGPVADQRATEDGLTRGIDRVEKALQRRDVCRLGSRVGHTGTRQRLNELVVEHSCLGAQRLVFLAVAPEQRRDGRGHLVKSSRRDRRGRQCRQPVNGAQRISDRGDVGGDDRQAGAEAKLSTRYPRQMSVYAVFANIGVGALAPSKLVPAHGAPGLACDPEKS
jgi:hypothetical protein